MVELFQKLIKGQTLIRGSRVEFFSEINKRAYPFIRHIRVGKYPISSNDDVVFEHS